MIRHQEVTEFLGRLWQSIVDAPIAFTIAVTVGGIVVWVFRGWLAKQSMGRLREQMAEEVEVLQLFREKHALEVKLREKIEVDYERLQRLVERLHGGDTASNQLIVDASAAIETAMAELRQAHDEFVRTMQIWDKAHHRSSPRLLSAEFDGSAARSCAHGRHSGGCARSRPAAGLFLPEPQSGRKSESH